MLCGGRLFSVGVDDVSVIVNPAQSSCYTTSMAILLDNYTIEKTGHIQLNLAFDVHVTAKEAQKTVNLWLKQTISTQLSSRIPTFVLHTAGVHHNAVWRVAVQLTLPQQGAFPVSTVDVSAVTGEIIAPDETQQQIIATLENDVRPQLTPTPFKPRTLPANYHAKLTPQPHFAPR